jgi:hypothetical protein
MKLSKPTLALLRNFATINSNLLIKPGQSLSTINNAKNVIADGTVTETFETEFGIYDLNEFLGVVGLFTDPDITFTEKTATIKEAGSSVRFYSADASVLTTPSKKVNFPAPDIEFALSATQLSTILKTASVLRGTDVSVVGKDGKLTVEVGDIKNATANGFTLDIGETDKEFSANIKVENLKLMPINYTVSISSKKISRFQSEDDTLTVFVALESSSVFN